MYEEYKRYSYDGPISSFDKCVATRWIGETMAPTESKARSNLTYQAKKQLRLVASAKILLPGKIKLVS